MITKGEQKRKAMDLLNYMIDNSLYGDLLFKFENGNVVHMEFVKRMKMQTLSMKDFKVLEASKRMADSTPHRTPIGKILDGKPVDEKAIREGVLK